MNTATITPSLASPRYDRRPSDMRRDDNGVLRVRHSHLALHLGVSEHGVLDAISKEFTRLERTSEVLLRLEDVRGDVASARYLTLTQAKELAEIVGQDAASGQAPFDAYFASAPRTPIDDVTMPQVKATPPPEGMVARFLRRSTRTKG